MEIVRSEYMYLEEFCLDIPYIIDEQRVKSIMEKNNCSQDDAISIDYSINWKDKRRLFSLETRCMSSMFERLFGKMQTKDCWKILIECVNEINQEKIINYSGVYTIQVKFDYNSFEHKTTYEKKQEAVELIMKGCMGVAKSKGWDLEPFETVYCKIVKENYINEWTWKKSIKSKNKKINAELICCHGIKCIDIYIILRDKDGLELARKKVISELPHEFAYASHLGKLKWISNDEVALVNKKGDKSWNINFETIINLK